MHATQDDLHLKNSQHPYSSSGSFVLLHATLDLCLSNTSTLPMSLPFSYKSIFTFSVGFFAFLFLLRLTPLQEVFLFPSPKLSDDVNSLFSKARYEKIKARPYITEHDVTTEDGIRLHAFQYASEKQADKSKQKVILMFHGIQYNIVGWHEVAERLRADTNCDAWLVDYRGYGLSEGRIRREQDLLADAEASFQKLLEMGYAKENIFVLGWSMGGVPALYLSAKYRLGGLILMSTFSHLHQVFYWTRPLVRYFLRYHFDNEEYMQHVQCRTLITHGTEDPVIPSSHGEALYRAALEHGLQVSFFTYQGNHYTPLPRPLLEEIHLFLQKEEEVQGS